jgi:lysophospholipase L1-like esterase
VQAASREAKGELETMHPHRPIRLAIAVIATVLLQLAAVGSAAAEALPGSMASTGDSITRAFNTSWFPFIDAPANSWSTGTSSTVNSHYRRILALNPAISGRNYNDAVSGAQMLDLAGQMQTVAGRNVGYVTVLMGGNDVCRDSEAQMTSVQAFHDQFAAAMNVISTSPSQPLVYVVSIPNVYNLWAVLKDNASARTAWSLYNVCQSMLANPQSMAQADVDRRARVAQRDADFNAQLASVCAFYPRCRFDGNAVFNTPFTAADIGTRDYFHPSVAGQAKLASVSWQAGPYVAAPPPATTLHVGSLAGSSAPANKHTWTASVAITVHDSSHATVGGVTVSGTFTGGPTVICTTSSSGACTARSGGISVKTASVTFTVSNLAKSGATYDSAANHVTSVVVSKP